MSDLVGKHFHKLYADSIARWRVESQIAPGEYLCVIDPEQITLPDGRQLVGDYAGHREEFAETRIRRLLAVERKRDDLLDEREMQRELFLASLQDGDTIHYDNGFGQFVRYECAGPNQFKAVALLGAWRQADLEPTFDIEACTYAHRGYYAQRVLSGEVVDGSFIHNTVEYKTQVIKGYQAPDLDILPDLEIAPLPAITPAEQELSRIFKMGRELAGQAYQAVRSDAPERELDQIKRSFEL